MKMKTLEEFLDEALRATRKDLDRAMNLRMRRFKNGEVRWYDRTDGHLVAAGCENMMGAWRRQQERLAALGSRRFAAPGKGRR